MGTPLAARLPKMIETIAELSKTVTKLDEENRKFKTEIQNLKAENVEVRTAWNIVLKKLEEFQSSTVINISDTFKNVPEVSAEWTDPPDVSTGSAVEHKKPAATSSYLLIGSKDHYLDFCEPPKSVDPRKLELVDLSFVIILVWQQLRDFLKKCPNLKVLRLSNLHICTDPVTWEKVELNNLEEFTFWRFTGPSPELIDTLSQTVEDMKSQILFTKEGTPGPRNFFNLRAAIKLQFVGAKTRTLLVDPKLGKFVSNFPCTNTILVNYMESALRHQSFVKIALHSCNIEFEHEVKSAFKAVRELSLYHVGFQRKSGEIMKVESVLSTFGRLERLTYIPTNEDRTSTLWHRSPVSFPTLKWLRINESVRINWSMVSCCNLDIMIGNCSQFRTTPTLHGAPATSIVSNCSEYCRSIAWCGATLLLREVLQQHNLCSARTQWIWVRDFPRFRKVHAAGDWMTKEVESGLESRIEATCTNFTLRRQSAGDWLVHGNTKKEIKELTDKYFLSWDKFSD